MVHAALAGRARRDFPVPQLLEDQRPLLGHEEWHIDHRGGGMTQLDVKVEIMRAAGLLDDEIIRLAWLKRRVLTGHYTELTPEYKRLLFAKWLYNEEYISS